MNRKLYILPIFMMSGLAISCGPTSSLSTDGGSRLYAEAVATPDNILVVEGFTAGGGYSESQRQAYTYANRKCSDVYVESLEAFGRFRVIRDRGASGYQKCGEAVNESPFGSGYLYVYRPVVRVQLDPEDEISRIDGIAISGIEAKQHSLFEAYSSYIAVCFAEIKKLKQKYGGKFVAASCGKSKSKIRMSYSESHGKELPNLTISSKMNIYLRANDPGRAPDYEILKPEAVSNIGLVDLVQSFASATQDSPEVFATHFSGAITKVNLKTKKIVWEQNLTNPKPNTVRETTSINTSAVSSDGRHVAVGGNYGYLALLDGVTGEKTRVLSCHPQMFLPYHY